MKDFCQEGQLFTRLKVAVRIHQAVHLSLPALFQRMILQLFLGCLEIVTLQAKKELRASQKYAEIADARAAIELDEFGGNMLVCFNVLFYLFWL